MHLKSLFAITAMAAALAGSIPASSQPMPPGAMNREAELIGLHQLCDRGDRQACIRFGVMLGEAKEHHVEWRRTHADWWAWDHR